MPYLPVGKENSGDILLHYRDQGSGKPVVLIHGYPLSGTAWEKQLDLLIAEGRRVIAYDRRGFGWSSQPVSGYDYDTFAADLDKLMTALDLNDATLIGHSMGTGEICRYLARYGSDRVEKAVFISPLAPHLLKSDSNPEGVALELFEGFQKKVREDRFSFLKAFFGNFFGRGALRPNGVSDEAIQAHWNQGAVASAKAIHDCIATWMTDFRGDLPLIEVPSLIVHGTADQVIPYEATAVKLHQALNRAVLVPVEGASHGLLWTHAEDVNRALLRFLSGPGAALGSKTVEPLTRDLGSEADPMRQAF